MFETRDGPQGLIYSINGVDYDSPALYLIELARLGKLDRSTIVAALIWRDLEESYLAELNGM